MCVKVIKSLKVFLCTGWGAYVILVCVPKNLRSPDVTSAGHMRTEARGLLVTVFRLNVLCDMTVGTMSSTRNCLCFLKKTVTLERN
jgi:hypothetical protein